MVGVLLAGVFATPEALAAWGATSREKVIMVQAIGAATCLAWSYGTGLLMWWLIAKIIPLRIGVFEEQVGLNYSEHQVASPLQDLTTAMTQVGQQQRNELLRRLDNPGTGDSAALAEAVKRLIASSEQQLEHAQQLATGLTDLRGRLHDQQATGADATRSCQQLVAQATDSLDRILAYLAEHREADAAVPLMGDLLATTRDRLVTLMETLPRNLATWRGVESAVQNLDGMLAKVRGARA
jgi:hypothetical protein